MSVRFIFGLLSGIVIGASGAVIYSVQTGRDLRQEFEQIRADIQARDFDALGGHLEERFKELQSSLEQRFSEGAAAIPVVDDASRTFESVVDEALESAEAVVEEATTA